MKKNVITFIIVLFSQIASAENDPIISLYEYNPRSMVIGPASPTYALYENGTVIFWDSTSENGKYKYALLSENEILAERKKIEALKGMESQYSFSNRTGQPGTTFYFSINGMKMKMSIYGNIRDNQKVRARVPKQLLETFDYYVNFKNKEAQDWQPTHVEIMIWPYENASDKSIIWPKEWPDTNSPNTRKQNDIYSLYLPYEKYESYKKFIATRNARGAVEINGKKWAVTSKLPFPHEMSLDKSTQPNTKTSAE